MNSMALLLSFICFLLNYAFKSSKVHCFIPLNIYSIKFYSYKLLIFSLFFLYPPKIKFVFLFFKHFFLIPYKKSLSLGG